MERFYRLICYATNPHNYFGPRVLLDIFIRAASYEQAEQQAADRAKREGCDAGWSLYPY